MKKSVEEAKAKAWKSFKVIKKEAVCDMIKKMASANYKGIGVYTKMKIRRVLEELNVQNINLDSIRILCYNGIIEDCRGLRSAVWKLILSYLPLEPEKWKQHMDAKLEEYEYFKKKYIPTLIPEDMSAEREILWDDIEKDIKRTRSDVSFFTEPIEIKPGMNLTALYEISRLRKSELTAEQLKSYVYTHADVLGRILFIYGCLHPDILYVQGMNELLAVIYYVFAKDLVAGYEKYLESDAFFVFEKLMEELKDMFNEKMDKQVNGLKAKLKMFEELIERNRKDLLDVMNEKGVDINVFTLRWQMLLLTQEFTIPDVIRLWDSLLADMMRFNFFQYVCLALVVNVEQDILESDADAISKAIKESPSRIEMKDLIQLAKDLLAKEVERENEKAIQS